MMAAILDPDLLGRYGAANTCPESYPGPQHFRSLSATEFRVLIQGPPDISDTTPLALHVRLAGRRADRKPCEGADAGPLPEDYLRTLKSEIGAVSRWLPHRGSVEQLHLDGMGQLPLSDVQVHDLIAHVDRSLGFAKTGDLSIELDPGAINTQRLDQLLQLGFTDFAMRVHKVDATVRSAIRRLQGLEASKRPCGPPGRARVCSTSLELVYGAPDQMAQGFELSLDQVVDSQPDRVSLRPFRYAIAESDAERTTGLRLRMKLLSAAVLRLSAVGYVHIGMNVFVRPVDELARATAEGRLQRGLHGYSSRPVMDRLGVGLGSWSRMRNVIGENARSPDEYLAAIESGSGATMRGGAPTAQGRSQCRDEAELIEVIAQARPMSEHGSGQSDPAPGSGPCRSPAVSHVHAVVLIDHQHAKIHQFDEKADTTRGLRAHSTHTRQHDSGVRTEHAFFAQVCDALESSIEVLVTGSRLALVDFRHYVEKHCPQLAEHIVHWETVDHPSEGQLLAFARKYFTAHDRMNKSPVDISGR